MKPRIHVTLWGKQIGAVVWDDQRQIGIFQYTPEFPFSGIQLPPVSERLPSPPYSPPLPRPHQAQSKKVSE